MRPATQRPSRPARSTPPFLAGLEIPITISVAPEASTWPRDGAKVVVVIEDDPATRAMIVRALSRDYIVYEASDGQAGLDLLDKLPTPDVIICDVMMPHVDGLEVLKRLRMHPRHWRISNILLTAKSTPKDVLCGINAGARHYLTKPFSVKSLLEKVESVIDNPVKPKRSMRPRFK